MAGKKSSPKKKSERPKAKEKKGKETLYTLTEVAKKTGISMPTLQRYKKAYQSRIPSVGKGRRQRYPEKALAVFNEIKKENLGRRGRPRKSASAKRRPKASKRKAAKKGQASVAPKTSGLLTLSEIGRRTGISYPTLVRYVKVFIDQIPHEGTGRKRRFPSAAVRVFQRLRAQSKRGRRPKSALGLAARDGRQAMGTDRALNERIRALEIAHGEITRQLESVIETLKKPLHVTISSD